MRGFVPKLPCLISPVGKRLLARTSDSSYCYGEVMEEKEKSFLVKLETGDEIEYSYEDKTAVVCDSAPTWVSLGDHVIAMSPLVNASQHYVIGFVSQDLCKGENEVYEITFDNSQRGNCTLGELRKLPFFSSTHQGNILF